MIRPTSHIACALSAALWLTSLCNAQRKAAYELLPENVQAVVWIPDGERLSQQWEQTQLYGLANDPSVAPFFEEQRQEIQNKLVEVGWRLNVKPEDIASYVAGQVALAWVEMPTSPRKPYAMALLADVEDAKIPNEQLLQKVEFELVQRQAQKTQLTHGGVKIAKYTLPKRADSLLAEDSFYAIVDGQFLATDDERLIKNVISRIRGEEVPGNVISQDHVFIEGRQQLTVSGDAQVEYFVRPLGFARVLRAIGGKRSKSNADMLAVLQNQGFDAIQCVCGEIELGLEKLDIVHRGYILVTRPLPKSAAVLDFPNKVSQEIPSFVGKNISTLLATHWNAKEAFWRTEGLVDELAGTPGVFDEVIQGIKKDPNGPRIDIEIDVLPHFTNDIFSISDNKEGDADVDSRRNLIALRLNNPTAMANVLDRAMSNEPDAQLVNFEGHEIWKVVHRDDEEVIDLSADFGTDFGAPATQAGGQPQPWLSNWAITVYDDYLMFASHIEMIHDAITQSRAASQSPLLDEQDYQRVSAAIQEQFGGDERSIWQVVRTSLAYRVQYELFREGKLRQSQSMLATILDRILQNDSEIRGKEQRVSGAKLPPFEQVAQFLQPSGLMVRTTDHGWEFASLMLAGIEVDNDNNDPTSLELSDRPLQGTARAGNSSEAEAKR